MQAPIGHKQSRGSAEHPKQNAFRQQLPGGAGAARAERGAQGYFSVSRRRAREQKVGDIDAGGQ